MWELDKWRLKKGNKAARKEHRQNEKTNKLKYKGK
jgi:hypothetical protein